MTELDPGLKDLIAATEGDGPSDRQRRRLQAAVLLQVGTAALTTTSDAAAVTATTAISAAAAVGVATAPAAGVAAGGGVAIGATAAGGSLAAFAAKLVAIGAVVAGVGTGGYTVVTGHLPGHAPGHGSGLVAFGATANPEALVPVGATADGLSAIGARATAPAVVRPAAVPDPVPPVPEPPVASVNPPPMDTPVKVEPVAIRVRPVSAPARAVSAPTAAVDTFEEETAALGTALSGLRSGQAAAALAALDEQDAHYRKGALGEERAVARIETLCALGRTREAGERATRFLAQHPGSLQAARVRASCGASKSQ